MPQSKAWIFAALSFNFSSSSDSQNLEIWAKKHTRAKHERAQRSRFGLYIPPSRTSFQGRNPTALQFSATSVDPVVLSDKITPLIFIYSSAFALLLHRIYSLGWNLETYPFVAPHHGWNACMWRYNGP
jgi:hypothetical protein